MSAVRVGIDIGGTFTDIVVLRADGSLQTKKVSSTVDDYSRAIVTGLGEVLRAGGLAPPEVEEVRHGTTVASNAILERKGAKTAIVTQGDRGSVLVSEGLRLRAEAYRMPFVDGTGGGDAFAAGYVAGMLRGWGPQECLRLGSAVGASCVRAIGTTAGVFRRDEAEAFLRQNELRIESLAAS